MPRPSATSLLIPFVYFIAGATSLAGVATTFYYKDDLHLSIAQVQILASLSILPWSIKPLYGFVSDRVPVFGLRRKPYLIAAGLAGSLGYLLMATVVHGFTGAVIASLISALGFALADVIVDGIVVEQSRSQKEAGRLQVICRASLMTGALLVAYLSGILVEAIGPRSVFFITGLLPLGTMLFAFTLRESRDPSFLVISFRETWKSVRAVFTPAMLWSIAFLFIWRSTPTSGGAFTYYLIDTFHFTPEFFGRLALIGYAASIIAILVFRKFLLAVSLKKLFFWVVIASIVLSIPGLGLIYGWYALLGISPQALSVTDTVIGGALQEIGFLPLLILAARLCPKGIEATVFALLASIMNIGLAVSDAGGGWLVSLFDVHSAVGTTPADYSNLATVMWIAILSSALPLPLLPFLPDLKKQEGREYVSAEVRKCESTEVPHRL